MPVGKNQHYVPQYLLRAWAEDGRTSVFHLDSGTAHSEPVYRVCADNYLYGHAKLEHELSSLEGEQSQAINKIQDGDTLACFEDHHLHRLCSFVTSQFTRTKAMQIDIELSGEEILRDAVQDDMDAGRYEERIQWTSELSDEEKVETLLRVTVQGIHHRLIAQGIFGFLTISDLGYVMLCNVSDEEFVTSDTPVILDNPRFKHSLGLKRTGIANRGLQMLCPIDPGRILLLYDPIVYNINSNHKRQLLIRADDMVDELNLLQFHNAESIVIFDSSSEDYINGLSNRTDEVRRRDKYTETFTTVPGDDIDVEYTPRHQTPKITPELPGCREITLAEFVKRRPTSKVSLQERYIQRIFSDVDFHSDAALIYAIRLFESHLKRVESNSFN